MTDQRRCVIQAAAAQLGAAAPRYYVATRPEETGPPPVEKQAR